MSDIDNIFTKFQEIFKKAETLNDSASFSFIKANLPMLKSSQNPNHRFVAMRLENKLKENENYQNFVSSQTQVKKEEVTKEERKEHFEKYQMKSNQQAANNKVQEDKKKAAEAERVKNEDLAYYKRINDQVAYNARINQIFLELELEKQQEIIQVQEKFKPENQQAVRNFIIDKTQTEHEATQNLAKILNSETATFDSKGTEFKHLKVRQKDGKTTVEVDPKTSIETLKDDSDKSNAVFKQALGVGNIEAAMSANKIATTVEVTQATKEAEQKKEKGENTWGKTIDDRENDKQVTLSMTIEENVNKAYPKLQSRIHKIEQNPDYSDEKKSQKIKEAQEDFIDKFSSEMKKQGYDINDQKTQNILIDKLSRMNFDNHMNLEGEELIQAETKLKAFSQILKLDENKLNQELTKTKEAAEQAIKDFNDAPMESQQATTQETQEKNFNNVELAKKDEHTGLVSSDSSNETKEQVQQQIENDKKATEAMFNKKKDVAEVYSEMKNNEENTKNGEIINNDMSNNAKETTEGRIDKSSLKNSVDESWAYGIAQEEAKRKDDSGLNKTAEEINKISNSNDGSNGPK